MKMLQKQFCPAIRAKKFCFQKWRAEFQTKDDVTSNWGEHVQAVLEKWDDEKFFCGLKRMLFKVMLSLNEIDTAADFTRSKTIALM